MNKMLFTNMLPRRARTEFCALDRLEDALDKLGETCQMLHVHARTQPEREEWEVLVTKSREAYVAVVRAMAATMDDGVDTYDAVAEHVDVPRMFRLIGEADALGRLHVRSIGTSAYTDIAERVSDVHQRIVRLCETHAENERSKRFVNTGLLASSVVRHPYS